MGTPPNGQDEMSAARAVPRSALEQMPRAELFALARRRGVQNTMVMTRDELLEAIELQQSNLEPRNGRVSPPELIEAASVRDEPQAQANSKPDPEPEPLPPTPEAEPTPRPPRSAATTPLSSPKRRSGTPMPGVAAAAIAAAVFIWRRRR